MKARIGTTDSVTLILSNVKTGLEEVREQTKNGLRITQRINPSVKEKQ